MPSVTPLLTRLNMYVPGCPEPLMENQLQEAAAEFCRDTHICYEDIGPISSADGKLVLASPNNFKAIGLLRLAANGYTIWSRWPAAYDNAFGYLDSNQFSLQQPLSVVLEGAALAVRMVPAPTTTQVFTARIVVGPVLGDNNVPQELIDNWGDALVAKAAERLMMQPNQMYSAPALATKDMLPRYLTERTRARIEVNRGLGRNGTAVSGPKFTFR